MKKISFLLCLSILISSFSFALGTNAYAATTIKVYLEVTEGRKCDEAALKLHIENAKDLQSANLFMEYNTAFILLEDGLKPPNAKHEFDGGKVEGENILSASFYWQTECLDVNTKTHIATYYFKLPQSGVLNPKVLQDDCIFFFNSKEVKVDITQTYTEKITIKHSFSPWAIIRTPSCIAAGEQKRTCTVCGYSESLSLPPTGTHSFGPFTQVTAPTCTEPGEEKSTCTLCGMVEHRSVPALGHKSDKWKVTKQATCSQPGEEEAVCTVCKEKVTREIPPTGEHIFEDWKIKKAPTCANEGTEEGKCKNCSETTTRAVPATGIHSFSEWETKKAATCAEEGLKERKCKNCLDIETQVIPKSDEHNFGKWIIIKHPTCAADGEEQRVCSVCGTKETRSINKTGIHSYGAWITTMPATAYSQGTKTRICSQCKKKETTFIPILNNGGTDTNTDIKETEDIKLIKTDGGENAILIKNNKNVDDIKSIFTSGQITIKAHDGKEISTGNLGSGAKINQTKNGVIVNVYVIIVLGDVNGDGKITASDARSALRIAASLEKEVEEWQANASDVNADSKITAADARTILRVAANMESFK